MPPPDFLLVVEALKLEEVENKNQGGIKYTYFSCEAMTSYSLPFASLRSPEKLLPELKRMKEKEVQGEPSLVALPC